MAELDLDPPGHGPEPDQPGPGQSPRSQRRHRQKEREAAGNLTGRLQAIFDRLADRFDGKGDHELADVIREDSKAMVSGLVNLTKRIPGAAAPILVVLGVVEPVLAFGRLFRLLANRWAYRRAERNLEPELDEHHAQAYCGAADCELGPEAWHVPHEHTPEGVLYL